MPVEVSIPGMSRPFDPPGGPEVMQRARPIAPPASPRPSALAEAQHAAPLASRSPNWTHLPHRERSGGLGAHDHIAIRASHLHRPFVHAQPQCPRQPYGGVRAGFLAQLKTHDDPIG